MTNRKQADLLKRVAPYAVADTRKSVVQILNTVIPYLLLWGLAYVGLGVSVWLSLAASVAAAGFFVRMFIIFHDCTHRAFFRSGRANRIWGNITGILTLFPYEKWRHDHAIHHAVSGNLAKRGTGDVRIMTVEEYARAPWHVKLAYRLYRNPLVMFGLGPFYLILIDNRLNHRGAPARERRHTHLTTAAAALLYGGIAALAGWQAFLIVQLPIWFLAGLGGIWLFYVQHQFEDSYFEDEAEWDYVKAAIEGSSYYKLPKMIQWITGNIGFHHVHHLSPRVPNYRLEDVHNAVPELQQATVITFRSSLRALRFRLYDENRRTFISFREYGAMRRTGRTGSRSQTGKPIKIG